MNRNEAVALREQRQKAHAVLSVEIAKTQTTETRAKVQKILSDIDLMTAQINKIEQPGTYLAEARYSTPEDADKTIAFGRWLRGGLDNLSVEQRAALKKVEARDITEGGNQGPHVGSYSSLGFFVPTGFVNRVEQARKYFSSFDDVCGVMKTSTGNALPYPISNDTNNKAVVVDEASPVSEKDLSAGHIVLTSYKLTSGLVKASNELLTDSSIDVESWLADRFGERYGRGEEQLFTTGTGVDQPTGILTDIAASGATAVTAIGSAANDGSAADGTNSIGYQDLVNLEHSVDPSYRRNAMYMFHDNVLGHLKTRLDKFGRPIWVPSVIVGEPALLNGYKYAINQSMASTVAAGNTTMIFGDFSKFVVRRVSSMSVKRLAELYAVNDEVGFISFERVDSRLIDAGTHPLNVLMQHT